MFKANRVLAIIALFFFVFSMASCGGGGGREGGGTETTPPQVSDDVFKSGDGTTQIEEDRVRAIFGTDDTQVQVSASNTGLIQKSEVIYGIPYLMQYPPCSSKAESGGYSNANCGPTSYVMAEAFFKNNSPNEGYLKMTLKYLYEKIFGYGDPALADQNYLYCGGFLNESGDCASGDNPKDDACGASIYDLEKLAQAHSLNAQAVDTLTADEKERAKNVLINASKDGQLVIVRATYQGCNNSTKMIKDGYGHYMLVTGIDINRNIAYVNDPYKPKDCSANFNYKQYTIDSFLDSWCNKEIEGKKYCFYVLISPKGKSLPIGIINSCLLFPDALVGEEYSAKLSAIYGIGTNYKWTVIGNLPDGLTLTPEGLITGKPTKEGTYTFRVRVYDESTNFSDGTASIKVSSSGFTPTLTITIPKYLTSGNESVLYNFILSATGGKAPYNWSIVSGNLPSGLSLNPGGVISCTPTTAGTYSFTAQVKDSSSPQQTASKEFSITIFKSNNDPVISSISA